jgi:hypothetical protein
VRGASKAHDNAPLEQEAAEEEDGQDDGERDDDDLDETHVHTSLTCAADGKSPARDALYRR